MKRFAIAALVLGLTGCGSPPLPVHPAAQKDLQHNPVVAFVGDSIVTTWISPATQQDNPMWFNFGTPPGTSPETSTSVLSRLPVVLAAHPDVVVILVGTFDIEPGWSPYCDPGGINTCANLMQMIALAHAAGSKVLLCNLPITLDMGTGTSLYDADPALQGGESVFNDELNLYFTFQAGGWDEDAYIDLAEVLIPIAWTDDGVSPNALGIKTMNAAVLAQMPKVGGNK